MRHSEEQRAEILRDAKLLGMEEACRKHGIHRSTLYRMKTRGTVATEPEGKALLRDRIRDLALEHPSWGCDRLAFFLSFEGTKVSSPTVQKILLSLELGRREERLAAKKSTPFYRAPGGATERPLGLE